MKLRIGSKMLAGFWAMTVLILAGGLVTILYTYRLQDVSAQVLAENVSSLKVAQELEISLFRMRGMISNYIVDEDSSWLNLLQERKKEWQTWMDRAQVTARSTQENDILQKISSLFSDFERDLQTAQTLNQQGKSREAKSYLIHASRTVVNAIYEHCEDFIAVNETFMHASEAKTRQTNSLVRGAMYGLGFGGIVLGSILGWIISRSIVNPIYELVLKVRGATHDDEFVERLDFTGSTEIEELDRQVHTLIDRVNTAMTDLEKNRRLLVRSEKLAALGKVAASVAHEIRNPLTAINMLIYSMREELAQDDLRRQHLAVVLKEIDRLERFVYNFLQSARPPDPVLTETEVNDTLRETLTLLAPRLRQNEIEVREDFQSHLPKIFVDADQLKQVLMNLMLNAIDAMPKGGCLTAETRLSNGATENADAHAIQIHLRDTGRGIPEQLLDSIFDPFVSGRKDGTGLGLSVAYQIVHRHGGWIEANNNAEGGATFTVSLPRAATAQNGESMTRQASLISHHE